MLSDHEIVLQKIVQTFDRLGVAYFVGGSVASSIYGEPRLTHDIDIVVDLAQSDVEGLVAATESEFYVDAEMIEDAIQTRSSCNLLHLPTMVKVDIFLRQFSAWTDQEWARRQIKTAGTEDEKIPVLVASPEDMVLQKLTWYRMGGGVSDRQWGDITGILKVQAEGLDYDYMRHWAAELGLSELLQRALRNAGSRQ